MPEKLSVIIPCFNEENLIGLILEKVKASASVHQLALEIIVVNDGSTDGTAECLNEIKANNPSIQIIHLPRNKGKGAAIRTALEKVTGDITIIQDADLEYDPSDYHQMIRPIAAGHADVVYGSRFIGNGPHRVLFFFHTIGNKFLTFLSNLFTGLNLTDMETGYKMFSTEVLKQVNLKENRFGFEPEVTAKISQ